MADASYQEEQSSGDAIAVGTALTSIAQNYLYNNTTFDRQRSVIGDAQAAIGIAATAAMVYNGTTYDRARAAAGVTGAAAVAGLTASDAALAAAPITIGGRASTALPTAMSADGDVVDAWLSRNGSLNVILRDTAGAAVATGTQQTEDAALGAVGAGVGTLIIGRASAAAPTSVSADGDAVGLWGSRFGALNTILRDTAGAAVFTTAAAIADAVSTPTVGGSQSFGMAYNGTTYDRIRLVASLDAAPNVDTGVLAVGIGPGYDRKQNPAGVAATSTANAVTIEVDGADTVTIAVTTIGTTPGSMIIETSSDDGTTWVTGGSVLKLGVEAWVSGSFVPAVGDAYLVRTTGLRRVRYRVNAVYASGTATIKWTGSTGVALIKAMDLAPQPHNFGQTVTNYQSASLGVTTSGVAIAATAGKRVYITGIRCSVGGTTAGSLAIYSGTGAFTEGTSQTAFFGEFAPSATLKPGVIMAFAVPWASATVNEDIRITTVGLTATHIQIQYYIA